MNEIIILLVVLICLITTWLFYKVFEKRGLYFSTVIISLLSFIMSFKLAYVFKMNINLGIVPIVSLFTIYYIYLKKYGQKDIKDLVIINTISNVVFALLLVVMNYYIPSITETISINMQATFESNYKIMIMYPIITIISELLIIKLYSFIILVNENTFISVTLTYILTAIIYTIIFYMISYINILYLKESIFIGITSYIIGLLVQLINIIFITLITKSKKVKKWETYYLC